MSEEYVQIIEPTSGLRVLDLKALVHYRDLLFLMVRRDFVAKYKQTVLGPAWFIIQPLVTTVIFTVIFGRVAKLSTDGIPETAFYLCGLLPWSYFSASLPGVGNAFISNAGLFSKVYFPRLIVPLSLVISNLLAAAIQLVMFLGFWVYFKFLTPAGDAFGLTWAVALVPLLVLQTACIALGLGLCLAALTARYRDLSHALPFIVQIWMYLTTIAYPLSMFPERWRMWAAVNPLTPVVESFRYAFFGKGAIEPQFVALSVAMTIVLLFAGLVLWSRSERTLVDVV